MLRRPLFILRGLFVNRDRPDFERLRSESDPERFLWGILPHAARTFSACIALLPTKAAKAAATAYLYCRILDTYEDLSTDRESAERNLLLFAERFDEGRAGPDLPAAPAVECAAPQDLRDETHLLLARRCELVDRVHSNLDPEVRTIVAELVRDMAAGMVWSSRTFADQGGVLVSDEQVTRYCQAVIGNPVVFTIRLMGWVRSGSSTMDPALRRDAMAVGEMVQLANITRDIEKDLRRGIAYGPELGEFLGRRVAGPRARAAVRATRRRLMRLALRRAPSYRSLVLAMAGRGPSLARASAILMLLFTDRYYRSCASRAGLNPWSGRSGGLDLMLRSFPAFFGRRWALEECARVERNFLSASGQPM